MNQDQQILSDIGVYTKYAKYNENSHQRESYSDIVDRNIDMHIRKFPELEEEIRDAYAVIYSKQGLPSMRSMQFAGRPIEVNPARIFNCSYLPVDDILAFSETMFLLLSGTGVGYSVQRHHVEQLPPILLPNTERRRRYLIGDSIEGWADAVKVLVKSYFSGSSTIDFDYSDIRAKGAALITSGGKAPGPEPLMRCIEAIRALLDTKENGDQLYDFEVHDIMCLIADAVLAGGIRRAALIAYFSLDSEEMLECKSSFVVKSWSYMTTLAPTDTNGEPVETLAVHTDKMGEKFYDLTCEVEEPGYGSQTHQAYWVREGDLNTLKTEGKLPWFYFRPHRGRANNSAVFVRHRVTKKVWDEFWTRVKNNKTGEPGAMFTNDRDILGNPCNEISLRPFQFCNLGEINAATVESQEDLEARAKAIAFICTLQASYTDFHYLRPVWKKTTEKEALIGVSLTGIAANKLANLDQKKAALVAVEENKRVAALIGINPAARVTTIKPAGTSSIVLGCSSGIHEYFSKYWIRRMRIGKNEAIYSYLQTHLPGLIEDEFFNPDKQAVLSVPQAAPEGALLRGESATQTLERIKFFYHNWIVPGHQSGANTNNISATVSIKDDEWEEVGEWMWENRDSYNGIAVLPYDGGTYIQAPFEEIDEETYNKMFTLLKNVNLSMIFEFEDNTDLQGELACAGGACEIV